MFATLQMYLSTTVLITIVFSQTSISQFEEYPLPQRHQSLQPPSPSPHSSELSQAYHAEMGVLRPTATYPYPLFTYLRLTSKGKTQIPSTSSKEKPTPSPSSLPYIADEQVATVVDEYRVPSHFVPLAATNKKHRNTTAMHFSGSETHEDEINNDDNQKTSNSSIGSGEENDDNAIGVEHLPTIAIPFLDTLTHGILAEIHQHVQLIKPGTKWCGEGNKARHYDDVGVLHKTDKCCRNHDKCSYYILSHEKKFGLHNDAHFTRSHCDCDASFYDCLKQVNSPFSTGVGITYFNILRMKCFRLEYPVVMCSQSTGWFSKHCVEYIVDMGKRKQWQWFDNHEF